MHFCKMKMDLDHLYLTKRKIKKTLTNIDFTKFLYQKHPHLNRDKIKSNLSVPEIQGHHENALIKSFESSPWYVCRLASMSL